MSENSEKGYFIQDIEFKCGQHWYFLEERLDKYSQRALRDSPFPRISPFYENQIDFLQFVDHLPHCVDDQRDNEVDNADFVLAFTDWTQWSVVPPE